MSSSGNWKKLACALAGSHGESWSIKYFAPYLPLKHISNHIMETTGGKILDLPLRVVHRCDNLQVVKQCNGEWAVEESSPWIHYLQQIRWRLHVLSHCWKIQSLLAGDRFFVHVRRTFNFCADSLANLVLDSDVPHMFFIDNDFKLHANDVIMLSSDGASRGNPGPSSAAAIVQVMRDGVPVTIAYEGVRLVDSTNVKSEYEAAYLAQNLFFTMCLLLGVCS